MSWLVLSYSLPTKFNPSSRVRLWRRLRKTGAVSPKAGVYVLPCTDECIDAMRWLATEVEQEQGSALLMKVNEFENLHDADLIDAFRTRCREEYEALEAEIQAIEETIRKSLDRVDRTLAQKQIAKLRKKVESLGKVDFFQSVDKNRLSEKLHQLQKGLLSLHLVLMILLNIVHLNDVVLRKMKEEPFKLPCAEVTSEKHVPSPETL